jgi:actin related protein 2/3 complex subunit 1A/1B
MSPSPGLQKILLLLVFSGNETGWQQVGTLDGNNAGKSGSRSALSSPVGRLNTQAFQTFRNADSRGVGGSSASTETELATVHQDTITSVRPYEGQPGAVQRVSTSGVDGKLVIWNVNAVSALTTKIGGMHVR